MSAALISWTRPETEAKNSRLPKKGELIQDIVRPSDLAFEAAAKRFKRDAAKSEQTGMETYCLTGYRRMATILGCCARTAFTRMKRLREIGMAHFERRFEANGAPAGTFMADVPWKTWLDDQKQNPQIAKTPDGYIITRNGTPLSVEDAERLGIRYTSTVAPMPVKAKTPAGAPPRPVPEAAPLPVNIAAMAAVLHRFEILDDTKSSGARSLLVQAQEEVPDITAEDLAAELGADLKVRERAKAKRHEELRINVPYVATFIRPIARRWAAWRAERRAEEHRRAEAATRAERAAAELNSQWAYEQFASNAMDLWIESLDPAVYDGLAADALAEIRRECPRLTVDQQRNLVPQFVRHRQKTAAGIPSMADWLAATGKPPDIPSTG